MSVEEKCCQFNEFNLVPIYYTQHSLQLGSNLLHPTFTLTWFQITTPNIHFNLVPIYYTQHSLQLGSN